MWKYRRSRLMNDIQLKNQSLRPIFGGLYLISENGDLYSVRSQKFLRSNRDRYGYQYYVISIDNLRKTLKAHRLVAETFIPNPENKPTVNHKNGVRDDNRVCNLEWATVKEQANDPLTRAHILEVSAKTNYYAMGAIVNFGRKKTAVYKNSVLLGVYDSLRKAAEAHKANYFKASECANGNRKSAGGVQFCYV